MRVRVALIGSGIQSRKNLLPAIKSCANIELKAIYSRTLKSAQRLGEGIPRIVLASNEGNEHEKNDLQSLIVSDQIDAVIIALPIDIQLKTVRAFLENGKYVLSEKPIAAAVNDEELDHLLQTYRDRWCIAENYRFLASFLFAAGQIKLMGKVLSFRTRVHKMVYEGEPLYETKWRKTPQYQGGFLLDGGVHFIAATRMLLGSENEPVRVSAFSSQLQKHLPPIDTVNSVWQLKSGISGIFACSFGLIFQGDEYTVVCERGSVTISKGVVTVEPVVDIPNIRNHWIAPVDGKDMWNGPGIQEEVDAWASGILSGKADPRISPEEALMDLKILEAMLRSGENGGVPIDVV